MNEKIYRIIEKTGNRFIVQELMFVPSKSMWYPEYAYHTYVDLKEYNTLKEARKYKYELELEQGIVIE